jgi:hypothetical protein
MAKVTLDPETVKRDFMISYLGARSDQSSRLIDGFVSLLTQFQKQPLGVNSLIQETVNFIKRQFRLRWVMIGLRNQISGVCKYEVESGMRPDVWKWQKQRTYKIEDFALTKPGWYNASEVSRLTRIYLEEENPLGEDDVEKLVNRPIMMKATRQSKDDALETDFIDTLILTADNDLLGWIEYGGTIAGKFPDPMAIRWIELIATTLATVITTRKA